MSGIHLSIQSPFAPYLHVQYDDHFPLWFSHLLKLQVLAVVAFVKRVSHEYLLEQLFLGSDEDAVAASLAHASLSFAGSRLQVHHQIDGETSVKHGSGSGAAKLYHPNNILIANTQNKYFFIPTSYI